jgi:hypothetical protein
MENASRDREIELNFKHAKAFEYGKHVNDQCMLRIPECEE